MVVGIKKSSMLNKHRKISGKIRRKENNGRKMKGKDIRALD